MNNIEVKNFTKGLITEIEPQSIPRGALSSSLNWISRGDYVEMRAGSRVLGTQITGSGRLNGLHTAYKSDGTKVMYRARTTKLEYSLDDGATWTEVGTDILYNELVTFINYNSPAGNQVWLSSPNMGKLIKILVANPASYTDVYTAGTNYCGYLLSADNCLWTWGVKTSLNVLFRSHQDQLSFTDVTAEVIDTGDGGKTYGGTLAFKAAGAKRTCFSISATNVTGTAETFSDNRNGTLTGSLGGTGTIDYTSGVIALTFANNIASGNITCTYQWEDSTVNGIADYAESGTRVAGEGISFSQASGGDIETVLVYNQDKYCIHQRNIWKITSSADDTDFTNLIFRENIGIESLWGAYASADGIYLVDSDNKSEPRVSLMSYADTSDQVLPVSISDSIDLSNYYFDRDVILEAGEFLLIFCRETTSTKNNRCFRFNKLWKLWDLLDYSASCATIYDSSIIVGDDQTNNVWLLFSGITDDEAVISNSVELNLDELDIVNLKKLKRLRLQGLIQKEQSYKVYASYDNDDYVELGEISGDASYVDIGESMTIGTNAIGNLAIGGESQIIVYNYDYTLPINSTEFQKLKIKFEAQDIGYVSISNITYRDIRVKSNKPPSKYKYNKWA